METSKRNIITLISILTLLVIVTSFFVIAFTFAGSPNSPDAVATYTANNLSWSGVTANGGIAELNIFGDPRAGEALPLIHPNSSGTYYLRLKNSVWGSIGYNVYIYTDDTVGIPMDFDVVGENTPVTSTPAYLSSNTVLKSFSGRINGGDLRNFEIRWQWDSQGDLNDTTLGDMAATQDLTYNVYVLIVIEDNNSYTGGFATSGVRLLHRPYITGYPEGDFRPDNHMLRSEAATIFARILADFDESTLTNTATGFNDVSQSDWCAKYISALKKSKVVNGYDDGSFKPYDNITRAEFAAMCIRFFEGRTEAISAKASAFNDVPDNHWAKEYIDKAAKKGFITGYPDGSFKPDESISRAEVVAIVNRMLGRYPDKRYIDLSLDRLKTFTDVTDSGYWAYYEIFEASNEHHTIVYPTNERWNSLK